MQWMWEKKKNDCNSSKTKMVEKTFLCVDLEFVISLLNTTQLITN